MAWHPIKQVYDQFKLALHELQAIHAQGESRKTLCTNRFRTQWDLPWRHEIMGILEEAARNNQEAALSMDSIGRHWHQDADMMPQSEADRGIRAENDSHALPGWRRGPRGVAPMPTKHSAGTSMRREFSLDEEGAELLAQVNRDATTKGSRVAPARLQAPSSRGITGDRIDRRNGSTRARGSGRRRGRVGSGATRGRVRAADPSVLGQVCERLEAIEQKQQKMLRAQPPQPAFFQQGPPQQWQQMPQPPPQ
ncbi:hypothetical protein K470DRAFT_270924 [Piedraia hortae CBS 480.64]|uniref:Uncharacterized protein n=1 Tax=Piedraia hortae CBS 480.64 TaxID=1314780 RepID=A0A6A7BYZ1_9PEZI|nr:hypothetical protein K470DRAFT_270924 [Piedraia hortae CBS 480.64]